MLCRSKTARSLAIIGLLLCLCWQASAISSSWYCRSAASWRRSVDCVTVCGRGRCEAGCKCTAPTNSPTPSPTPAPTPAPTPMRQFASGTWCGATAAEGAIMTLGECSAAGLAMGVAGEAKTTAGIPRARNWATAGCHIQENEVLYFADPAEVDTGAAGWSALAKTVPGGYLCNNMPCAAGRFRASENVLCTPCAAGRYADANTPRELMACEECAAGRFGDAPAATGAVSGCKACAKGEYQPTAGQPECKKCATGTFNANTGEVGCVSCPAGRYGDQEGLSAGAQCPSCPAGQFSGAELAAPVLACTSCAVGQFSAPRAVQCTDCAVGKYNDATGATACTECKAGTYADQGALALCKSCAVGRSNGSEGSIAAAACIICVIGRYADQTAQAACNECASGMYQNQKEQSACKGSSPCPAGKFGELERASQGPCKECRIGLYQEQMGQGQCKDCPNGKKSLFPGSSAEYECRCEGSTCCGPGTILNRADNKTCLSCAPGQLAEAPGQDACDPCPRGTFQEAEGKTFCSGCPSGRSSATGGSATELDCLACPAGRYQDAVAGIRCKQCAAGQYQPDTGKALCLGCQPGSWSSALAKECTACAEGRFGDINVTQSTTEHCRECAVGRTFQALVGRTYCLPCTICAAGTFEDDTPTRSTDRSCAACGVGRFSSGVSNACTACDATKGEYQDLEGQSFCRVKQQCVPGTYDSNATRLDAARCVACPAGSFSSVVQASECTLCNATNGEYQLLPGQTFCEKKQPCVPGFFESDAARMDEDRCQICVAGRYSGTVNAHECVACPEGKVQVEAGKPFCENILQCEPGSYRNGTSVDRASCFDCPAGSWCSAQILHACGGAGFFCPANSSTPTAVAVGHYTTPEGADEARRTGQVRCEEGFSCQRGVRSKCPAGRRCGFASDRTTKVQVQQGASSAVAVVEQDVSITAQERCEEGYFAFNGTECVKCPKQGADCEDGLITLQPNFWYDPAHGELGAFWRRRQNSPSELANNLYRCPVRGRCLVGDGGLPRCLENHGGPLCSVCDDGHYSGGPVEGCQQCPGGGESAAAVVISAVVVVAVVLAAREAWKRVRAKWPNMDLTKMTYEMPQIIKLATGMFQIVGSFTESFHAVQWPDNYVGVAQFFGSLFNFNFFGQPVFACQEAGRSYPKRFMWHTLTVLFVALVLVGLLLAAERVKEIGKHRSGLWNTLLPFLFIVYPSVSNTVILMLRCVTIDGSRYLLADYSVRCDDASYGPYRDLALFFVVLFPIGIPAIFTVILARNRSRLPPDWWPLNLLEEEDRAFSAFRSTKGNEWAEREEWREHTWRPSVARWRKMEARFGFLFNAYHHSFYWFESVMSVYKLAMTTLVVFVASADTQGGTTLKVLYSMFMATCLIALVAFLQPFKDADVLSVETMVQLELLFVLFAALYLQEVENPTENRALGVALIILLLLPLMAVATLLYRGAREELRRQASLTRSAAAQATAEKRRGGSKPAGAKGGSAGASRQPDRQGSARKPAQAAKKLLRLDTEFSISNPLASSKSLIGGGGKKKKVGGEKDESGRPKGMFRGASLAKGASIRKNKSGSAANSRKKKGSVFGSALALGKQLFRGGSSMPAAPHSHVQQVDEEEAPRASLEQFQVACSSHSFHNAAVEEPEGGYVGWAVAYDEEGNVYYYHDETGETSWEAPAGFEGSRVGGELDLGGLVDGSVEELGGSTHSGRERRDTTTI